MTLASQRNCVFHQCKRHCVIEHIEEPTDWLSPIFVVPKPNEDIRVCVNLRKLNQAITERELDQMSTMESTLELQR